MSRPSEWSDAKLSASIRKNYNAADSHLQTIGDAIVDTDWELLAEYAEHLRSAAAGLIEMAAEAKRRRI